MYHKFDKSDYPSTNIKMDQFNDHLLEITKSKYNVMWDLSPHDLSIILYLIGKAPISIYAIGNDVIIFYTPKNANNGLLR